MLHLSQKTILHTSKIEAPLLSQFPNANSISLNYDLLSSNNHGRSDWIFFKNLPAEGCVYTRYETVMDTSVFARDSATFSPYTETNKFSNLRACTGGTTLVFQIFASTLCEGISVGASVFADTSTRALLTTDFQPQRLSTYQFRALPRSSTSKSQ